MKFEFLEILNIITIVWLLFFSAFLFTYKKGNNLSNNFLGWLLLTNAFFNFSSLIRSNFDPIPCFLLVILFICSSTGFFFGPAIYFYTKSITNNKLKLNKNFLLHFIPFILSILFYLVNENQSLRISYFFIKYLHILIYIVFSFKIFFVFQSEIKELYSSIDKLHIKRLLVVLIVFTFLWFGDVLFLINFYNEFITRNLLIIFSHIFSIVNFAFSVFVVYDSLTHPELLNINLYQDSDKKYKNSKLSNSEKKELIKKLDLYCHLEKPYLNSSLMLSDLANSTKIPPRSLSQIINKSKKMNFYDYINSFRIKEAQNLLSSSPEKTVLEILYEVGFNSKSSFNSAFKKNTGMTPSKYKLIL